MKTLNVAQMKWLAERGITYAVKEDGNEVFAKGQFELVESKGGYSVWSTQASIDPEWDLSPHDMGQAKAKLATFTTRGEALAYLAQK